jgi:Uma2 family endonuclease
MVQIPLQSLANNLQPDLQSDLQSDLQAESHPRLDPAGVGRPGPDWAMVGEEWESDEPELESDFHRDQIDLLLRLMKWIWRDRSDIYCSGNTTVYYDESQRTNRNFRGPDIYVVLGAEPRPRRSWMIWREDGKYPDLVIELLSNSTAKVDRTTKKTLYQDVWKLPNYVWFHPETMEFRGFRLVGDRYEDIAPTEAGWLWIDPLELFLGLHEGQLRLFTAEGELLLLEEEAAQQQVEAAQQKVEVAQQQVEAAQQQVEQERSARELAEERSARLAAKLQELGIEAD